MSNVKGAGGSICLKGSIDIVCEFLEYGINSILYQRGLYPSDSFLHREKYGLPLLVTGNPELKRYLDVILNQLRKFLETKSVHKVVLAIFKLDTTDTVERWQFDLDLEKPNPYYNPDCAEVQASPSASTANQSHHLEPQQRHDEDQTNIDQRKLLKKIQDSIKGVIRQITASVTFLPMLEGSHSFDILLYTDKDVELPNSGWNDTSARLINNGEHVQLRGFTTHVHRVAPVVSYRPS